MLVSTNSFQGKCVSPPLLGQQESYRARISKLFIALNFVQIRYLGYKVYAARIASIRSYRDYVLIILLAC